MSPKIMVGAETVKVVPSALQLAAPKDIEPVINPAIHVEAQQKAMQVVLNLNNALTTIYNSQLFLTRTVLF